MPGYESAECRGKHLARHEDAGDYQGGNYELGQHGQFDKHAY